MSESLSTVLTARYSSSSVSDSVNLNSNTLTLNTNTNTNTNTNIYKYNKYNKYINKTLTLKIPRLSSPKSLEEVQATARKVESVLGKQTSSRFPLYCKYAWQLSEAKIFFNLEAAQTGRNPHALFTWLCEQDMKKASDQK
jgi:hypothetical protein